MGVCDDCMYRPMPRHWQRRGRDVHHKGVGGDRTGWAYAYGCARMQPGERGCACVHGWDKGETGEAVGGLAKGTAQMDRNAGVHPCIHV